MKYLIVLVIAMAVNMVAAKSYAELQQDLKACDGVDAETKKTYARACVPEGMTLADLQDSTK